MAKYKYVDGVKYRVVPQSVLGYALVREGSDNSLPAGGTEGQVLTKASDTDYDVEWSTVEGGGGATNETVLMLEISFNDGNLVLDAPTWEVANSKYSDGALPVIFLSDDEYGEYNFYYADAINDQTNEVAFRTMRGGARVFIDFENNNISMEAV